MNRLSASRRCMRAAIWATVVLAGVLLFSPPADTAAQDPKTLAPRIHPVEFQVIQKLKDGAWLVPTLRAFRSPRGWDAAMDNWVANQQVVGREPAPAIDWEKNSVIVLALGTRVRRSDVTVKNCHRIGEDTIVDLHFDGGEFQWDPIYTVEHPSLVISVARADLKAVLLQFDAVIDDLPPGLRRTEVVAPPGLDKGPRAPEGAAITPVAAGDGSTTWGRVKALYRSAAPTR
ncbi:MAG: hypothetical protein ABI960_11615 [Candidatus Eisenbacteria bacterium]